MFPPSMFEIISDDSHQPFKNCFGAKNWVCSIAEKWYSIAIMQTPHTKHVIWIDWEPQVWNIPHTFYSPNLFHLIKTNSWVQSKGKMNSILNTWGGKKRLLCPSKLKYAYKNSAMKFMNHWKGVIDNYLMHYQ